MAEKKRTLAERMAEERRQYHLEKAGVGLKKSWMPKFNFSLIVWIAVIGILLSVFLAMMGKIQGLSGPFTGIFLVGGFGLIAIFGTILSLIGASAMYIIGFVIGGFGMAFDILKLFFVGALVALFIRVFIWKRIKGKVEGIRKK